MKIKNIPSIIKEEFYKECKINGFNLHIEEGRRSIASFFKFDRSKLGVLFWMYVYNGEFNEAMIILQKNK